MDLLEVRDLHVSLSTSSGPVDVVSGLDFDIPRGSMFGLAGESGCGKSMTALAIMGILPPGMTAAGQVLYRGTDLLFESPEALRRLRGAEMAMIFQEPMTSLNPVLRVGAQIREVLTTHLKVSRREAEKLTLGLLRSVHIPEPEVRIREYPHQMSGGMRQRIMMAMAIACSPALLIADEPTTALDVTIEAQILELLRSLQQEREMSVLLITHDLAVLAENAEEAAVMYAGRIVEHAPVTELFHAPRHPYTVGLLESLPRVRGTHLRPIPGSVPKPGHLPPGCKFSDRCGYVVDVCRAEEPALVNVNGTSHQSRCIRWEEVAWNRL